MVGGLLFGNLFEGFIAPDIITNFAYFGIILLLFTIGLETNLERMFVLKKFILVGGLLQIALSIFFISLLSILFGFSFLQALLIGVALSASSTTLVAKIIQERGEESSFMGELAIGILMFQDLAFIPFIIIFSTLHGNNSNPWDVAKDIILGIGESSIILCIIYLLGRKTVPYVFNKVARVSRELLNLFIILFIFFIGFISLQFKIPILVGMFIAGILVSQTLEHYHIFSQMRPLRDLLGIIFFAYIGTQIKVAGIIYLLPQILLFTFCILLTKALVLLIIFLYMRFSSRVAFSLAIFLFQMSENAFILLSLAFSNKLFTSEQYSMVISSVLLSLILTPVLISHKEVMYFFMRSVLKKYVPSIELFIKNSMDFEKTTFEEEGMTGHVIICGYGRVGAFIGRALTLAHVPFIAIDYNFHTVERAKRQGITILYGDPTDMDVLSFARVEHAIALISAVPERISQESVILNAKQLNPRIVLISRVHTQDHQQQLRDLGAHIVVQPELEASVSIIKKILYMKGFTKEEMLSQMRHFKLEQGAL